MADLQQPLGSSTMTNTINNQEIANQNMQNYQMAQDKAIQPKYAMEGVEVILKQKQNLKAMSVRIAAPEVVFSCPKAIDDQPFVKCSCVDFSEECWSYRVDCQECWLNKKLCACPFFCCLRKKVINEVKFKPLELQIKQPKNSIVIQNVPTKQKTMVH